MKIKADLNLEEFNLVVEMNKYKELNGKSITELPSSKKRRALLAILRHSVVISLDMYQYTWDEFFDKMAKAGFTNNRNGNLYMSFKKYVNKVLVQNYLPIVREEILKVS